MTAYEMRISDWSSDVCSSDLLCTFGVVGHALLKTLCDYRPERLRVMRARFSAPVYPGETIRTAMWRAGEPIAFRARIAARDVVVLNNGPAEVTACGPPVRASRPARPARRRPRLSPGSPADCCPCLPTPPP